MEPVDLQRSSEGKFSGQTAPNPEATRRSSDHPKQGGWITFPFIIGTVLSLALAVIGSTGNMIVYLITELNMKSITATQIFNVFHGILNLFPIAGAIIADSCLSSFYVVSISTFISLLGMIILTLIATVDSLRPPPCTEGSYTCETPSLLQRAVLYTTLALIAIGFGGTRFTMAAIGANQFDKAKDQGIFFNWFFLAFYIGTVISFTAIIYIQDNVSWVLSFGICAAANAIGLALFLLGKQFYRHIKPEGSPFTSIARVIAAAIRKRNMSETFDFDDCYYHGSIETSMMLHVTPTKSLRFLNNAALKSEYDTQSDGSYAKSWRLCTVEEVENVKTLIKIIPLWSTGLFLPTLTILCSNLTILQALTMDRRLGSSHFKIPAATILVFYTLTTAISLLLIDRFLLPMLQILRGQPLSLLERIGIGHTINIVGIVGFALVEMRRLHVVRTHHLMDQPNSVVSMSALWLVVPLMIIGFAEAFWVPGQTTLYYQEFPRMLKSTSTAMFTLHIGIGYYLSTAILDLLHRITGWLPNNINNGRVDNVFWMLAVIGIMNLGYYLACAKLFKYQNDENKNGPNGPPGLV